MRKPATPSEKLSRGTFRADRDAWKLEAIEPGDVPVMPPWLTDAGREIWLDDIARATLTTETDSTMFGMYANLAGACTLAWKAGDVPPAAYLAEVRRLAEMLGLGGRRSRMTTKARDHNPFERNGKRGCKTEPAQ